MASLGWKGLIWRAVFIYDMSPYSSGISNVPMKVLRQSTHILCIVNLIIKFLPFMS
jgi:hypothetical protein